MAILNYKTNNHNNVWTDYWGILQDYEQIYQGGFDSVI